MKTPGAASFGKSIHVATVVVVVGYLVLLPLSFPQIMVPSSIRRPTTISSNNIQELVAELYTHLQFTEIEGCTGDGNDVELCRECSTNFTAAFPLGIDDVKRSLVPGDYCKFKPVADKLRSGKTISVHVIGGSMTAGHGCVDGGRSDAACAWPSRLAQKFASYFNESNAQVFTLAQPGWSYGSFVANSHEMEVLKHTDVVIVDLVVNSQIHEAENLVQYMMELDAFLSHLQQLYLQSETKFATLFVDTFRTCAFSGHDCNGHCPPEQQGHMMCDAASPPRTYSWCNRWWYMADLEAPVVRHYQVPVVHYRDAVWPVISQPETLLPCYWNGLSHPDAVTHELLASLVANGLAYAIHRSELAVDCSILPMTSPFHQQLHTNRFCAVKPGAVRMQAKIPQSFTPGGNTGWKLREDVPGKPGWVFENANGTGADLATIWFTVTFSELPQLEVTFLKTYEQIGQVRMFLGPGHMTDQTFHEAFGDFTLDGLHQSRTSVPFMQVFVHPESSNKHQDSIILPKQVTAGDYVVGFQPVPTSLNHKFKIISLSSC